MLSNRDDGADNLKHRMQNRNRSKKQEHMDKSPGENPRLGPDFFQRSPLEAGDDSTLRASPELPEGNETIPDRLQTRNRRRKKKEHARTSMTPAKKGRFESDSASQPTRREAGHSTLRGSQEQADLALGYPEAAGRYKPLVMMPQMQMQRQLDLLGANYLADDYNVAYGGPLSTWMFDSSAATAAASLRGASSSSVPLSEAGPLFAGMDPLSISEERFLRGPFLREQNGMLLSLDRPMRPNTGIYDPSVSTTATSLHGRGASTLSSALFADVDPQSIAEERLLRERLLQERLLQERLLQDTSYRLDRQFRLNISDPLSARRMGDPSFPTVTATLRGGALGSVPTFSTEDLRSISQERLLQAHFRCEHTRALLSLNHPLKPNEIYQQHLSRSPQPPASILRKQVSSSIPSLLTQPPAAPPTGYLTKQDRSADGGYSNFSTSSQQDDPKNKNVLYMPCDEHILSD